MVVANAPFIGSALLKGYPVMAVVGGIAMAALMVAIILAKKYYK